MVVAFVEDPLRARMRIIRRVHIIAFVQFGDITVCEVVNCEKLVVFFVWVATSSIYYVVICFFFILVKDLKIIFLLRLTFL